jgi:tRNA(Ile)-lysidine synthase
LKKASLFNRFKIHLEENFPEMQGRKILLAISGGIDSMVLLNLLSHLNIDLYLAHCNFNLRGQASADDQSLVQSEAKSYDYPLHLKQFDTSHYADQHKCSIQMAARELRYSWFDELLNKNGYDYLVTAHHADDNLETFFINLSRGTGIEGLTGIPEKADRILRPLLPFGKEEIKNYAVKNKLGWREDLSNQDNKYLRNKIRNELVPILKDINPSFLGSFSKTVQHLKGAQEIISDRIKDIKEKLIIQNDNPNSSVIIYDVYELSKISNNSAYLYELFYPYGFNQWKDIRSLIQGQSGKQIYSKTHRLLKNRDQFLLSEIQKTDATPGIFNVDPDASSFDLDDISLEFSTISFNKSADMPELDTGADKAHFDKDLLTFPLRVRKWEKGDYFYPIGMKGKKKLSKFFKDEKFSLFQKENIWLLCSGEEIIWVIGKRIDDRFKISDKTKSILKVTLQT